METVSSLRVINFPKWVVPALLSLLVGSLLMLILSVTHILPTVTFAILVIFTLAAPAIVVYTVWHLFTHNLWNPPKQKRAYS